MQSAQDPSARLCRRVLKEKEGDGEGPRIIGTEFELFGT
jgi:hypothetical protein